MSPSIAEKDIAEFQNPLLRVENISRAVNGGNSGKSIISDFSFDFFKGEIYSILGPSGAGKSSLLRLFNRLDDVTKGTIYYDGKDIKKLNPCKLRRKIGYLFQTPYMFPGNVKDNLLYVDSFLSDEMMISMLAEVNLGPEHLDSDVEVLSVGEKQRIALARLFMLNPEIVMLDEPTSALDEKNSSLILGLIKDKISKNGMTAIIVTHNPRQAAAFDGEALLLIGGKLVEHGPVEDILKRPETDAGRQFLMSDNSV